MNSLKFQSVFDIIGPVMIDPSSSHTAGAVRIGKIVSSRAWYRLGFGSGNSGNEYR